MKRFISILLVAVLFLSETSIAFAVHFCGDKLVSAQFNMGQNNNGCDMDNSDCDASRSTVSKKSCCTDSVISVAQTTNYEVFTLDWLIVRMPASQVKCEQVLSYAYEANIKWVTTKDPPQIELEDRSRLQVYLI